MGDRLKGKVGIITGGASGIGLGCARRFVAEGARVLLADQNEETLASAQSELGDAAATLGVDVRNESDLERMVATAVDCFGRVDIGVNSAGLGTLAAIVDQTEEQWDTVIDVNLKGVFLSMKHEARQMKAQGDGGVIINLASLNAFQPGEGMSAYCASKSAVEMLTRVGAMELGPDGIRVCGLAPGLVETPLTDPLTAYPPMKEDYLDNIPIGRVGQAQDIANAALFLASDEASWVSGETLSVDGGSITKRYPLMLNHLRAMMGSE